MKPTTEKQPIEVNHDRDDLNACIQEYYDFLENEKRKDELIADLLRNLENINQEIIVTQAKVDKPVYPKMRTVADVDDFLRDFGAPNQRLEALLSAKKELTNQLGTAQSEKSRYIDLASDIKKDAWFKLAKLLIKPIHYQLNQVIFAAGCSGKDFISFLLTENSNSDMSLLGEKLTSEYGMPK